MKLLTNILSFVVLTTVFHTACAQSQYELLYLERDYASIAKLSGQLVDSSDYYWNAIAKKQQGHLGSAIDVLISGTELYPGYQQLEKLLAENLFVAGRYVEARPLLEKYRSDQAFFFRYIRVLEFNAENKLAIQHLEERLESDLLNIELLSRLGDNYDETGQILSARDTYRKVVRINPKDIVTLGKLANIQLRLKEYEGAIANCEKGLLLDSTNSPLTRIKGLASFRKSDFITSAACFRQILASGDSGIVILKHLGISEIKNYDFHGAREHLLLAREKDTTDYELCFFLGRAFLNSTMPDSGLYYLAAADTLLVPDPEVLAVIHTEKASIYSTLEQYEKVLQEYRLAYADTPKPAYLFYMASNYQYRMEDKQKALEFYERFLEELPPVDTDGRQTLRKQTSISMKKVAQDAVRDLKEELFFEGKLE